MQRKDDDKQEIFRGHVEECVRHLANLIAPQASRGSRELVEAKQQIADFCGTTVQAVGYWLSGEMFPQGETLLKLMCYLDMIGYRIIELERMQRTLRNFAELIGFGIFSVKEAVTMVGYKSSSSLYCVLRGEEGVRQSKKDIMWNVWKEKKDELQLKWEKAHDVFALKISFESPTREIKPPTATKRPKALTTRHTGVVNIMEGLLVLLEAGEFDLSSRELVNALRGPAGNTILRLAAQLNTLSSKLVTSDQWKGGIP